MNRLKRLTEAVMQYLGSRPVHSKRPVFTKDELRYSRYQIGEWTYGSPRVWEWGEGAKLSIGRYCSIARDVQIFLGGEHRTDWATTYPFNVLWDEATNIKGHPATKGDVVIGNDVWIGNGAMITSGVNIGNGAVIGARGVVTKDVESYSVVAGNPARQIRFRFDPAIIRELNNIAWWTWPREQILAAMPLLLSDDIESFVQTYKSGSPETPLPVVSGNAVVSQSI